MSECEGDCASPSTVRHKLSITHEVESPTKIQQSMYPRVAATWNRQIRFKQLLVYNTLHSTVQIVSVWDSACDSEAAYPAYLTKPNTQRLSTSSESNLCTAVASEVAYKIVNFILFRGAIPRFHWFFCLRYFTVHISKNILNIIKYS